MTFAKKKKTVMFINETKLNTQTYSYTCGHLVFYEEVRNVYRKMENIFNKQ